MSRTLDQRLKGSLLHRLDFNSTIWLIIITLPLLFLPKINLTHTQGESAGLRIDDIILLFLSLVVFWTRFSLSSRLTILEKDVCIIIGLALCSFALNRILAAEDLVTIPANILYAVRILEYFLFYYVGLWSVRHVSTHKVLWAFLAINTIIIILQKAGLIGAFYLGEYRHIMSGRVTGIASFPTELGVLLNLIFAYLAFNIEKIQFVPESRISHFWPKILRITVGKMWLTLLFLFFGVLIIWTGTRAALFILLIIYCARIFCNSATRKQPKAQARSVYSKFKWLWMLPLVLIILFPLMKNTEELFARSRALFSWHNVNIVTEVWKRVDINATNDNAHIYVVEATNNQDVSWLMRLNKWVFALKSYTYHPEAWMLGLGPGFSGSGLDGGLLRVLVDGGLLSCAAYFIFFRHLAAISSRTWWLVAVLVLNMIFVDAHLAYKVMSLFFFLIGAETAGRNKSP